MNSLQPGTILHNRYEVKEVLKSGGMGSVYRALDQNLGIACALKELHDAYQNPQELQETSDRFRREAEILAKLRHPGLPRAFDYFEENGCFYFVMDFIEGEDLETLLNRDAPGGFPEKRVREIAFAILEILEYLHSRNPPVVYRDLKPSNIMVQKHGGSIILIDFGIARPIRSAATKKTAIGTEGYAPREQYLGNPEHKRIDMA